MMAEAIITRLEAEVAALKAENEALKFHVMDEDAVKTLGNVSYDLEQCEAKLAAVTAERDALKAIPVDDIKHVFHFCDFMGWGVLEAEASFKAVSKWLESQGEVE